MNDARRGLFGGLSFLPRPFSRWPACWDPAAPGETVSTWPNGLSRLSRQGPTACVTLLVIGWQGRKPLQVLGGASDMGRQDFLSGRGRSWAWCRRCSGSRPRICSAAPPPPVPLYGDSPPARGAGGPIAVQDPDCPAQPCPEPAEGWSPAGKYTTPGRGRQPAARGVDGARTLSARGSRLRRLRLYSKGNLHPLTVITTKCC